MPFGRIMRSGLKEGGEGEREREREEENNEWTENIRSISRRITK